MSMVLPAENGTMARIGFAAGQPLYEAAGPTSAGVAIAPAENLRK